MNKFRYYIVDDGGTVTGTNSKEVSAAAVASDVDVLVIDTVANNEVGALGQIPEQSTWLLQEPDEEEREPDESYNRDS